ERLLGTLRREQFRETLAPDQHGREAQIAKAVVHHRRPALLQADAWNAEQLAGLVGELVEWVVALDDDDAACAGTRELLGERVELQRQLAVLVQAGARGVRGSRRSLEQHEVEAQRFHLLAQVG